MEKMEKTTLLAMTMDSTTRSLADEGLETRDTLPCPPDEGPSFLVATDGDETVVCHVTFVVAEEDGPDPDPEALRPVAEASVLEWLMSHDLDGNVRVRFDLVVTRQVGRGGRATHRVNAFAFGPVR